MIVTCEACSARYKLDDGKVSAKGAKITCPRCRHVFVVYKKAAPSENTGHEVSLGSSKPKRSAEELDFRKVGIASWKVKVKIGLVYDFSDLKTLRKYIADGRVTSDDAISFDGRSWTTIGDIPDLDAYFIKVYDDADARLSGPGASDGFEEDEPTTIASDSNLATNLARMALAQVESEEVGLPSPGALPSGARPVAPPAGAPTTSQFVDPFAALKDKQRERIAQKRATTSEVASRQGSKKSNTGVLLAIVALIALGGAYFWASSQSSGTATTSITSPPPTTTTTTKAETTSPDPSSLRDEINKTLVPELDDVVDEQLGDDLDEPQLIPVVPEHILKGSGSPVPPQPTYTPPSSSGGIAPPAQASAGVSVGSTPAADHVALGNQAYQQGNYSAAITAYNNALSMQPSASTSLSLGKACFRAGQHDAANAALQSGSKPEAYKWLARVAKALGDIPGANGYYQQYLNSNPADAADIQAEMQSLM